MAELPEIFVEALQKAGLVSAGFAVSGEPIAGGVSSDIWKVETGTRTLCVKSALSKLRVEGEWHVPVSRSANEAGWLKKAAGIIPKCTPEMLAFDAERRVIIMQYLEPDQWPVWKTNLLAGKLDMDAARGAATAIRRMHTATANVSEIAVQFSDYDIFRQVRLDPYLGVTAENHADLSAQLHSIYSSLEANRKCLIHGDFSPKNILAAGGNIIILDAECAVHGDPAFDAAFCLNHLILKSVILPDRAEDFMILASLFLRTYLEQVDWEQPVDIERRIVDLLPALMLARIDGLSPVEYLTIAPQKQFVRTMSREFLSSGASGIDNILSDWLDAIPSLKKSEAPS